MRKPRTILIVDDDPGVVEWLDESLEAEGYRTEGCTSAEAALERLSRGSFDVVISDVEMPTMRGVELLKAIAQRHPQQIVILITAFGSIDLAVESIRAGAADFVTKPFRIEALLLAVERALRERQLRREVVRLREALHKESPADLVAESPAMRRALEMAARMADGDLAVLITGESGSGKGAVARFIHERGPREKAPFVQVNCAALPPTLAEAELFGVKKGAFTDAREDRPGYFVQARGGTLFLDELGELPLELQPKLLQALETRCVRAVGASAEEEVDVRIVAATNRPLEQALRERRFRPDLYHRLNVIRIEVPPLRERPEDLQPLVDHFLHRIGKRTGRGGLTLGAGALRWLQAQSWTGNVRELANTLERAVALTDRDVLTLEDFASHPSAPPTELLEEARDSDWSLKELERAYIRQVLAKTGGNKAQAARILGLDRRTLYRKAAELEAERDDDRSR